MLTTITSQSTFLSTQFGFAVKILGFTCLRLVAPELPISAYVFIFFNVKKLQDLKSVIQTPA